MRFITCYILLSLFDNTIQAQNHTNLVMEGAGIRGVAYAGAIRYLEETGKMQCVNKVGGTSAGAIAALAVCLGYTAKETEDLIYSTKLQKFNDGRFLFFGGIARLNRNYGWYRGKAFTTWLEKIIETKTGNANITFKELHQRQFKDLYVTGTSLNHQKLLIFSHELYPDMKVKDAVRISMSIPLYFEAMVIDSLGHILPKKSMNSYHDLVVDGGFTGNFPITLFDSLVSDNRNQIRVTNPQTLGLRIDTPEQIKYDSLGGKGLAPSPISRFRNYIGALYNYVIENLNRGMLTADDWDRTISISSGNIGPKVKRLSVGEKNMLIMNGYNAAKQYFE
jgi:NTE family protein